MNFNLRTPCANCPFRAEGAIELESGRVAVIVDHLKNDHNVFQCHKTVHHKNGGDWTDDGNYIPSGNESACIGALAYMFRLGYVPILLRLAFMMKSMTKKDITDVYPVIKDKVE